MAPWSVPAGLRSSGVTCISRTPAVGVEHDDARFLPEGVGQGAGTVEHGRDACPGGRGLEGSVSRRGTRANRSLRSPPAHPRP